MNLGKTPLSIDATAIREEALKLFGNSHSPNVESDGFQSLFTIKTANKWIEQARQRPAPKTLFGEFWFEGEICILFADTNVGKSILAVQIAEAIAGGRPIDHIGTGSVQQKVLYFDFELSDKQFEARYSAKYGNDHYFENPYPFQENLLRAEIDPNADIDHGFRDFEEYLHFSLQHAIATSEARILIIDNLTYLKNETERARDALPLMKYLKSLKSKFDLSLLALAHTPKRDPSKPLSRNDLQGSKMLINFCDSAFAIGESYRDTGLRYFKHNNAPNTEIRFGPESVYLCQIQKPENFLHFEFLTLGNEHDHLKQFTAQDRGELIAKAKQLSLRGLSQREISSNLGVSLGTVNKYLKI